MNLITKAKNSLKTYSFCRIIFDLTFQMAFTRVFIWPYERAAFIEKTKDNSWQGSRHGERETVLLSIMQISTDIMEKTVGVPSKSKLKFYWMI